MSNSSLTYSQGSYTENSDFTWFKCEHPFHVNKTNYINTLLSFDLLSYGSNHVDRRNFMHVEIMYNVVKSDWFPLGLDLWDANLF